MNNIKLSVDQVRGETKQIEKATKRSAGGGRRTVSFSKLVPIHKSILPEEKSKTLTQKYS